MENALAVLNITEAVLWHGFLVFLRVGAAVSVLPAFGETSVPPRVKIGLAVAFTAIVAPAVPTFETIPPSFHAVARYTVTEGLAGLLIGISMRMFVMALQTAGTIAGQSTSLAQLLGGASGEPLPAIGNVLVLAGLALAVTMGLHVYVARYLIGSYIIFPAGVFPVVEVMTEWGVPQVSAAFSMAFRLAAPFVIISALYNLMLGVINRAMPQLMVAFVGAPLITAGGLFILFLVAPALLTLWWGALQSFMINPIEGLR
ncbi:flagellar biosynthetic protein FliR [Shimia sp. R11_0]|uniref:flagellar biosynthetic protein FliR n=1 Tax=Shimia sp. R11_0 TaxID=2821096 RepID=UPI001AD99AFD|nr:flagellar biosynthetic protein FliR [Shimia sp. R11_0]MBO9476284.1 flagellar biosynthetic protein FliR [Shimia sp. R11_0]